MKHSTSILKDSFDADSKVPQLLRNKAGKTEP